MRKSQLMSVWNQTSEFHWKNTTAFFSTKKSQLVQLVGKWSFHFTGIFAFQNVFVFKICEMLKSHIISCHRKTETFFIQLLQIILLQIITLIKPKCFIYKKRNIIISNRYNNIQNSILVLIYSESSCALQKKFSNEITLNRSLKNV